MASFCLCYFGLQLHMTIVERLKHQAEDTEELIIADFRRTFRL